MSTLVYNSVHTGPEEDMHTAPAAQRVSIRKKTTHVVASRNATAKQQWDCLVCGESYSDSRSGESCYRWARHLQKVARVMSVTTD